MATAKKSAAKKPAKAKSASKKPVSKPAKTAAPKKEHAEKKVAVESKDSELLPQIQCFSPGKKIICANLILAGHHCTAKRFPNGRLATVRPGKKRRCEFYQETAYQNA